ncbi:MAG: UDP-N-acetylmuramoyl-L-alanyl-D-glutamate--2,6-diaminopimelate ligase [Opitutales bacterium]|nr:UDP-N-acetylmuramoyl-L-alanyl-D-glutamate--2,6-diaminopimelate ligase [Opitutales bacterium]
MGPARVAVDWTGVLGVPALGRVPAEGFSGFSCRPGEVEAGDLFFAFPEFLAYNRWSDGLARIGEARARGAAGVVADRPTGASFAAGWVVPDPRKAFAEAARAAYGRPDEALDLIGVTGTNGKTTTVRLIAHLAGVPGAAAASMGTLGCWLGDRRIESMDYTTDLAHESMRRLARLRAAGAGLVAMEVSSHALALDRVERFCFRAGVFTNFTQDHLDFHGDTESYFAAKRRLFERLPPGGTAVINAADPRAAALAAASSGGLLTYSTDTAFPADVMAEDVRPGASSLRLRFAWRGRSHDLVAPLAGRFQADNVLAAVAALLALGHSPERLCESAGDFPPVPGRMETVVLGGGATAVIDYAHNPGGLENLLRACRGMEHRKLLLVFGCGGDRDRGKRPLMGRLGEALADRLFVTSDNPRTEDPARIIRDILGGMDNPERAAVDPDRAAAIAAACAAAGEGDLVVVAGKGHEDYQIIGTEKTPFSDRREVEFWTAKAVD